MASPAGEMPANTIALSTMMQKLSAKPGFTEAFLKQIDGGAKKSGAALLTPALVDRMRQMVLGKDWQGLDHFPGWTMHEINPTVRVVGHLAGKDSAVKGMATAGGAPTEEHAATGAEAKGVAAAFVDLGEYALDRGGVANLDEAATGKPFDPKEYVTELGDGVTRGDGPNPELAPLHAESTRLAEVLNRLSLNGLEGVPKFEVQLNGKKLATPDDLMTAIVGTGHTVELADARYFANFGHLHDGDKDVMMPFYVNSQIQIPGEKRALLVPVSHAEYEWRIHGPKLNAAISFYFGIDGKAEFRTMDQLDQPWVMSRHAHEYHGPAVISVTSLAGAIVQAYAHLHQAHPTIPFGGYYAFGVCQDVVAAIELKMTGKATLFPNTADGALFTDARDAPVNALIRALPKDRDGKAPDVERIFGSLPVGDSDAELAAVTVPGLGADLVKVHDAWSKGELKRTQSGWRRWVKYLAGGLGLALGLILGVFMRRALRTK